MLGQSLLRLLITKYSLIWYVLVVAQLVLVLTSFSAATDCMAMPWADNHLCLSHISTVAGEHDHSHHQPVAIVPFAIGQMAVLVTLIYALTYLPLPSIPRDSLKPPPRYRLVY